MDILILSGCSQVKLVLDLRLLDKLMKAASSIINDPELALQKIKEGNFEDSLCEMADSVHPKEVFAGMPGNGRVSIKNATI